ncbi:MAG: Bax inhibitor-1/YccA family protein [Cyanobium sp.]
MTINGTAQKTLFLLLLAFGAACFTWSKTFAAVEANPAAAMPWTLGGLVVGAITGLVICFKHTWAPILAPVYALAEGLFLGGISASFEAPGQSHLNRPVFPSEFLPRHRYTSLLGVVCPESSNFSRKCLA